MLSFTLKSFPSRIHLRLFCSLNDKLKEIFGVYHHKIYVFDDSVLISGANLEDNYFKDRIDRYFLFSDNKMTEYFYLWQDLIKDYCFIYANGKFFKPKIDYNNYDIKNKLKLFNGNYFKIMENKNKKEYEYNDDLAYVYIMMQANPLKINYEYYTIINLLKYITKEENGELFISTAYLNFTENVLKIIENSKIKANIITSSEKANSFINGKGFIKMIAKMYTSIKTKIAKRLHNTKLLEYYKEKNSFHVKGIWYYNSKKREYLTVIGSSNYNYRSYYRDIETSLLIITKNKDFIYKLENERKNIMKDCNTIRLKKLGLKNIIIPILSSIFKKFL